MLAALAVPVPASGQAPLASSEAAGATEPAPSQRREVRIEGAIELRRDLGIRSGRAHVRRLEANDAHDRRESGYGIPLTASEARRLERRERAVDSIEATVRSYVRRHDARPEFAGLYVDEDAGGVVRVGFTKEVSRRAVALRELSSHPRRIETVRAGHSRRTLERSARAVARDLPILRPLGVLRVGVDVSEGAVGVVASDPGGKLAEELAARYPGAPIELSEGTELRVAANYERFPVPPIVGAIEIFRRSGKGNSFCSAGFVARARGSARRGVISAGHCGERGDVYRHRRNRGGTYRVGRVRRDVYRDGTTADAMLINRRRATGSAHIYTPRRQPGRSNRKRQLRGIRNAERKGGATEGEVVCRSGAGSDLSLGQGVSCGEVLATEVAALVFPGPTLVLRHVVADVVTCDGDSGGPVYRRHEAKGIVAAVADPLSGAPECGETLLLSQVGHVQDRLDARVVRRSR